MRGEGGLFLTKEKTDSFVVNISFIGTADTNSFFRNLFSTVSIGLKVCQLFAVYDTPNKQPDQQPYTPLWKTGFPRQLSLLAVVASVERCILRGPQAGKR